MAPYVGTNNIVAGEEAGEKLGEELGESGSVGILTSSAGDEVQEARWKGFEKGLKKVRLGLEVLTPQYVEADTAKAATATSAIVSGHSNLVAIYATAGNGGEGASSALRAAGDLGKIKIVSYDATPSRSRN